MSKVLIAADFHLHRWHSFGYHSDTLLPKRLFDQDQVLSQILKIIEENKVKVFINAGDLFHSVGNIPVEALNIAHRFYHSLDMSGVTCVFVTGNHDLIKRDNPEWFHISTGVFDKVPVMQNLGMNVKLIGFDEKIDYNEVKNYDIVVLHKTPIDARVNNYTFEDGINWKLLSVQNKMVFFGHIHQRAELSNNCFIVGSPMHLNFGDTGTRGVYLIDTDDNSINFLQLKYPEFRTVTSESEITDDYNYYRIIGSDHKVDKDNVVNIVTPKVFDERIKSEDFEAILNEWVILNKQDPSYITPLKPLLINKSNLGKKIYNGRIISVIIKDFISIGEIIYKFQDGFTSISGPNGNGKTAFVDAIFWCLFGETTKGLTGDDVIRRGQEDCHVQIILTEGDNSIRVQRSRKDGLRLSTSNESGVTDTGDAVIKSVLDGMKQADRQKYLEDILGFDKTIFLSSCYFSQENLKTITSLSDSEKTNMITNLLGFETYADLYDNVSIKIGENESVIEDLNAKIKETDVEIDKCKNKVELLDNEISSLNKWIEEGNASLTQYKNKILEFKNKKTDTIPINYDGQFEELKLHESQISSLIDSTEKEIESSTREKEEFSLEISEVATELKYVTSSLEELNQEMLSLENSNFGEKCDKCGAIIDHENVSVFMDEKSKAIINMVNKSKDLRFHVLSLTANKKRMEDELAILNSDRINYNRSIREIQGKREQVLKEQSEYNKKKQEVESQIDNYLSLIKDCKHNITNMEKRSNKLIEERDTVNDSILGFDDEAIKIGKDIAKITKDSEIFEFWKTAFSSKGIRSLLLDRFCNQFNAIVNDYLSISSNGEMSIVLNPIKTLKSGEDRNKLSLDINMGKDAVKYDSLSGGEKRRVDVSLCLALNKWMANRYNLHDGVLGLLIFDEIFSFLDREGEESIGALLCENSKDKIILVISHTPELNAYADNTINITKINGVSQLN